MQNNYVDVDVTNHIKETKLENLITTWNTSKLNSATNMLPIYVNMRDYFFNMVTKVCRMHM